MQPDQDNQKSLLLAIVLSIAVLLAWQFFYAGPKLKEEQERRQRIQHEQAAKPGDQTATKAVPGAQPGVQPGATPQPQTATAPTPPAADRTAALKSSPRVRIETPSLEGSIALKGARIDDLVLAKYHETVEPRSPDVILLSPSGAPEPYYAEYGWIPAAGVTQPMPGLDTEWKVEKGGPLTPTSPVTLAWDNGQGLVFRRTISVDTNYLFTVADEVQNNSGVSVTLYPYSLISRHGLPKTLGYYILHEGPIGVLGDAGLQELHYADLLKQGGTKTFKQTGGWIGITDKYWATALVPDQSKTYEAKFSGTKGTQDLFQTDFLMEAVSIPAGGTGASTSKLFAGAKEVNLVEDYAAQLGAKGFDLLIDWGWFYFITKPLYKLLHWLTQLLGNYGLAILATTVLVKAAFFPLANKSYESMAKMKKLQPEMEKLRERYKDDKVKQQQELMALYKQQKINPMAGCLPMVLQVPVFFALYKVLFVTIDMRHAPFFGWIKDLSAPDPTSIFNLFGLLPYTPPPFLHIGVWPLIMGMTMFVQMQLNPQQPDPVQQKIFNWMPVVFTFMLASFPSGLVIYWAWNNVLSLIQQYAIMRRNNTEVHLWKNLGVDKLQGWWGSGRGVEFGKMKERIAGASSALPRSLGLKRETSTRASGDDANPTMTREQALRTFGLNAEATEGEIDAAIARESKRRQSGLNGSDHVIAAKMDEARQILRGKAGP